MLYARWSAQRRACDADAHEGEGLWAHALSVGLRRRKLECGAASVGLDALAAADLTQVAWPEDDARTVAAGLADAAAVAGAGAAAGAVAGAGNDASAAASASATSSGASDSAREGE